MNQYINQNSNQPHIQGGYGVFTAWVMLNRVYRTESVRPKNIIKPIGIHNNEIAIYPNPAREQVIVNGASEVAYAIIYDLQGRELIKMANSSDSSLLTLNTSKLTKGIYFITLVDKDLSIITSEKLVIK
ncbi:MAG: T9SS type A sorting domain-containing protein [Bacteroidota bacterium]